MAPEGESDGDAPTVSADAQESGDGAPSTKSNVNVAEGGKANGEVLRDADGNIIQRGTRDGEGLEGGVLAGQDGPVDGSAFPDGTSGDTIGMPGGMSGDMVGTPGGMPVDTMGMPGDMVGTPGGMPGDMTGMPGDMMGGMPGDMMGGMPGDDDRHDGDGCYGDMMGMPGDMMGGMPGDMMGGMPGGGPMMGGMPGDG